MKAVGAWVKRHPIRSRLITLLVLFVGYQSLKPKTYDYVHVSETVSRGEVVRKVTASGKLRALNTIKVGAEVSGQVSRVTVDFNSPVKAGQVLAEIDPTRLRARVEQAGAEKTAEFPAPFGLGVALGSIAFSAFNGLLFGGYTAIRASRLSPIGALRSE